MGSVDHKRTSWAIAGGKGIPRQESVITISQLFGVGRVEPRFERVSRVDDDFRIDHTPFGVSVVAPRLPPNCPRRTNNVIMRSET